MELKDFFRSLLRIDPRWQKQDKNIVWVDGSFSYVFFNPWNKVTLPFKPRLTLNVNPLTRWLLEPNARYAAPIHLIENTRYAGEGVYEQSKDIPGVW